MFNEDGSHLHHGTRTFLLFCTPLLQRRINDIITIREYGKKFVKLKDFYDSLISRLEQGGNNAFQVLSLFSTKHNLLNVFHLKPTISQPFEWREWTKHVAFVVI